MCAFVMLALGAHGGLIPFNQAPSQLQQTAFFIFLIAHATFLFGVLYNTFAWFEG